MSELQSRSERPRGSLDAHVSDRVVHRPPPRLKSTGGDASLLEPALAPAVPMSAPAPAAMVVPMTHPAVTRPLVSRSPWGFDPTPSATARQTATAPRPASCSAARLQRPSATAISRRRRRNCRIISAVFISCGVVLFLWAGLWMLPLLRPDSREGSRDRAARVVEERICLDR
jgi:hypothetical protein